MNAMATAPLATTRILVVDDDRMNLSLLEVMLSAEGFVIETAAGGEAALLAVARNPPDVILLDVMMPGIDGYEVATRLKRETTTRHIPIIMITALHDQSARVRGLQAGAEDFLSKPVDRAELIVRVRNLVRLKAFQDEQLRFKDDFLSHVSHELRLPLTAIKQFSSILLAGLAGELNAEQRQYQEIVLRNIHQLQAMIDDLLEVTRLETGKLMIEPEAVSVAETVDESFDTLRASARLRGVTLTCDIPAALPRLFADPTRLRQILIILLDNAIKFSRSGGTVHTTLRACPGDDGRLQISVADTGTGMTPDDAAHVFDRLYQSDMHADHSRRGLGLGLFICRELVVRQGGTIAVTTEQDYGTTFTFTLPAYSLAATLAPLLTAHGWPADAAGLVVIDLEGTSASSASVGSGDTRWGRDVRTTVHRCLLPLKDVLLGSVRTGSGGERLFLAVFADERGVSILADRLRGEFERAAHLRHPGTRLTVSCMMMPPPRTPAADAADDPLSAMSAVFEEAILQHDTPRNDTHEQQEDSHR